MLEHLVEEPVVMMRVEGRKLAEPLILIMDEGSNCREGLEFEKRKAIEVL